MMLIKDRQGLLADTVLALQDAAKNGQIVVGDATYKAASREFKFRKQSLNLKGYDGSVPGFEVLTEEERKYRVRPDDTAVGARSAMIGRGLELNTIAERAENLHGGAACIVTVVGENGLGKSRLYSEVRSLPVMNGWISRSPKLRANATCWAGWLRK